MQWIKSHLPIVISGSVALVAIALLVLGMFMSEVAANMQQDMGILNSVQSVRPTNEAVIDEVRTKQAEANAKLQKELQALASQAGSHQPLVPEVFQPGQTENPTRLYQFRDRFREKMQQFIQMLNAGGPPTAEDVERERLLIESEKEQQKREEMLGFQPAPGAAPGTPGMPALRTPGMPRTTAITPAKVLTPEEAMQEDPAVRASLRRAKKIYCYATVDNLDRRPNITDLQGKPPVIDDVWYAQMALWIQEDVLGAVARLNQRIAETLPEKERWVGYLPVKEISNVAIGWYVPAVTAGAGATPGLRPVVSGQQGGPPPGDGTLVLTQRGTDPNFDVIQFALEIVVEARMLPMVIDEIQKAGYYTPLLVTYQEVPPNLQMAGAIYGAQPTIKARIEWEGCYLRSKYEKLMPETVKKAIAEGRPPTLQPGAGPSGPMRGPMMPFGGRREPGIE